MSTVANTNISSLRAIANLNHTSRGLQDSLEKLSSGYKINKGADDASGLAIATVMSAQIRGVRVAMDNASDAINMIQTADGALQETSDLLLRMRDLAVKSANAAVLTTADQTKLSVEFSMLRSEINSKLTRLTFNTKQILNSAVANASIQVGPDNGDSFKITISAMNSTTLKINTSKITSAAVANSAITQVDQGISVLGRVRSNLGTVQRRLNHIINDLTAQDVNMNAARSRIMDTDFATEISNFTKLQILQQTGTAVLSQANAAPQSIIQLLG